MTSSQKQEWQRIQANTGMKPDDLEKSGLDWSILESIRDDFNSRHKGYLEAAEQVANRVASFESVHSTKFRTKDPDSLIAKVIRKAIAYKEKPEIKGFNWSTIDSSNYRQAVTDLAGVRALHLYKQDWPKIDTTLTSTYVQHVEVNGQGKGKVKKVTRFAYIRKGDEDDLYKKAGCRVEVHKVGYRSVHYVIETRMTSELILVEIQVRTIFEEGWSEVDHQVRYPNFSHPLVERFLTHFNLLSGLADSLSQYVSNLRTAVEEHEAQVGQQKIDLTNQADLIAKLEAELSSEKTDKKRALKHLEDLKKLQPPVHTGFKFEPDMSVSKAISELMPAINLASVLGTQKICAKCGAPVSAFGTAMSRCSACGKDPSPLSLD